MPSGITAGVYEGTDTTLRSYLMRVGRAFGFAIEQRDSPADEPVKRVEPSTDHYERDRAAARQRLAELETMTPEAALEACRADHEANETAWRERRDERRELRGRYEAMIAAVEAWQPDPLIAEETQVKQYALSQLRESLKFDCGAERDSWDQRPAALTADEWLRRGIARARERIEDAERSIEKEIEQTADLNRYIDAFLASLPPAEMTADA